jgi:hypothetical protein
MSSSEFYYACHNGDIDKVKALLSSMSTTDIDRIEPNGSTALHAAAYFGYIDIVRLLLDKGASLNQRNKCDRTPKEEAKTQEIARLFQDVENKLGVDWTINSVFTATSQHRRFYSFSQGAPSLPYMVDKFLNAEDLWSSEFWTINEINEVKKLFKDAMQSNDCTQLIRAYTMESPFSRILNTTLASHQELTNEERENPPWFCAFARFLAKDEPILRSYRWTGITYRGVPILKHYLAQWQVGKMLMNKAFFSTTKSQTLATFFARRNKGKDKHSIVFKCIVSDDRAALDISTISKYENEEEVLILPCMDFQITEINDSDDIVHITLMLR